MGHPAIFNDTENVVAFIGKLPTIPMIHILHRVFIFKYFSYPVFLVLCRNYAIKDFI